MFDWISNLPIWLQVIIVFGFFGIFGGAIIFFLKGGKAQVGNIKIGKSNSFVEEVETLFELIMEYVEEIVLLSVNKKIDKQMQYAENKLIMIREKKEKAFFGLLEIAGVPHDQLTIHQDCQFYREVCGNMIYADNGNSSTKAIIKNFLKNGNFMNKIGAEYDVYIKDVVCLIKRGWDQYLNGHYFSEVIDNNGERKRVISREQIYDADENIISDIEDLIRNIFDNAKNIELETSKQKDELLQKRKEKVRNLITFNQTNGGIKK